MGKDTNRVESQAPTKRRKKQIEKRKKIVTKEEACEEETVDWNERGCDKRMYWEKPAFIYTIYCTYGQIYFMCGTSKFRSWRAGDAAEYLDSESKAIK